MHRFKVYCDNREKKPYSFRNYPVFTEEKQLETGDYCVATDGEDVSDKVFDPNYAIERKNPSDFLKSITWTRDRFEKELERADEFPHRMPVVIEQDLQFFEEEEYFQDVSANSIFATIDTHPNRYNIDYHFQQDRAAAEQITYEFLNWRYQKLKSM